LPLHVTQLKYNRKYAFVWASLPDPTLSEYPFPVTISIAMSVPRIKICGITNEGDARLAAELGADAVGLNFHPESARFVPATAVEAILRVLPPFVEPVGVFVNQPLRQVFDTLNRIGRIRTIQWFGDRPELCDAYPFHYVPSFPVRDRESLRAISGYLDLCRGLSKMPSAIAVDAHASGQFGGTGRPIPWHLLADFHPGVPLILAGGLKPENVAEAITIVRPFAVDVAGGVERSPGQKDAEKMRTFIKNARGVRF
jgi:phosphoribosylanthranilate isomerase